MDFNLNAVICCFNKIKQKTGNEKTKAGALKITVRAS